MRGGKRLFSILALAVFTAAPSWAADTEAAGLSRKTVNTVENGIFVPSTLLALKLAQALNVPVEQLFWIER